ncbi:unnamed protein product, partial [Brenthis ino]
MGSTTGTTEQSFRFQDVKLFPYANGKINLVKFLEATSDLIRLVEHLGKVFAPVKYDMEGNIEKIRKFYKYDESSCLLELMNDEYSKGEKNAIEGILWLNRALLFFELVFQEIDLNLKKDDSYICMKKIFTLAYEGSVKKYHGWITQQLFTIICKMSPTLPQIIKSLEMESDLETFKSTLASFNTTLHSFCTKVLNFVLFKNIK